MCLRVRLIALNTTTSLSSVHLWFSSSHNFRNPGKTPLWWSLVFNKCVIYFFLQLHADGIGLLQVDGVPPQLISERCELVEPPLPEGPLSQVELVLSPRHCTRNTARWVTSCDWTAAAALGFTLTRRKAPSSQIQHHQQGYFRLLEIFLNLRSNKHWTNWCSGR